MLAFVARKIVRMKFLLLGERDSLLKFTIIDPIDCGQRRTDAGRRLGDSCVTPYFINREDKTLHTLSKVHLHAAVLGLPFIAIWATPVRAKNQTFNSLLSTKLNELRKNAVNEQFW